MNVKKRLKWDSFQNKIFMPNEIFEDLKVLHDKGSNHVAFAYTYCYLISWLYRYAKYGELNIDVKMIKELLGYSPDNKKINYIIKKDGILDQIGYTVSSTDYPVIWSFVDGELEFTMLSEMEMLDGKGRNYKIKVPVKGLHRHSDNILDGTFFEIDYTHEMDFAVFVTCMEKSELGCSGFYLYGYLKYRCDKFKEYNCSVDRLAEEVGMSRNTTDKYLSKLYQEGLISYKENKCQKVNGEYTRKANTYSANPKGYQFGVLNNIN